MSFFDRKPAGTAVLDAPALDVTANELALLRGQVEAIHRSQACIEFDLDGTITDANENFLNAVGYTLDEIRGEHHRIFVRTEESETIEYQQFWQRLASGQFDQGEYCRIRKDGSEVWISATYNPVLDESGRPIKVIKYANDISKLKEEQADGARLLNMIDNMPTAIMYVDLDLVVQYANPATFKLLEKVQNVLPIPADQIVGACIDQFHKNPAHQRALLANPEQHLPLTTQIVLGAETVSFSVNAIYDEASKYIGAMATGRIMTEEVETRQKAAQVGNTVATSVSEMAGTIDEISKSVSRTATLAQDAEGVAQQTSEYVGNLGQSSRKIGEVVGVIQELADQTNLLALNATIEAARAGESGRSFAVVASEVKELANATAKATQNIEKSINEIQSSITQVVESTEKITIGIGEVSSNTTTVAAAIEEQSATMAGLGETADELQAITAAK